MADAPESPEALLHVLAEAQRSIAPRREPFYAFRAMGGATVQHPGIGEEELPLRSEQDLQDLADSSLIRVLQFDKTDGGILEFDVTPEGAKRALLLAEPASGEARPQGGLHWASDVLPVLRAVYAAYPRRSPGGGVTQAQVNEVLGRAPDDAATDSVCTSSPKRATSAQHSRSIKSSAHSGAS